jgi:hypothetical protein
MEATPTNRWVVVGELRRQIHGLNTLTLKDILACFLAKPFYCPQRPSDVLRYALHLSLNYPTTLRYLLQKGANSGTISSAEVIAHGRFGGERFLECMRVLLSVGWLPDASFLCDCAAGIPTEIFCRLVEIFHANARVMPDDLLSNFVALTINRGIGIGTVGPPLEVIIMRLIAAGAVANDTALKLAVEGKLYGCVAKIAEAMTG